MPNLRHPLWLIRVERTLAQRDRGRKLVQHLANRRLNSVIDGLLSSLYWQAYTGLMSVQVERHEGESDQAWLDRCTDAMYEQRGMALVVIRHMIEMELAQRGKLGLVRVDAEAAGR